jgi:hypothetical protein
MKKLMKKYNEQEQELKQQEFKMANLKESIEELIVNKTEDSTKLPPLKSKQLQ